jgi:hypothetical protein
MNIWLISWKIKEAPTLAMLDVGFVPPGFGIDIGWTKPAHFWKPYILVQFWRIQLQIGWLLLGLPAA